MEFTSSPIKADVPYREWDLRGKDRKPQSPLNTYAWINVESLLSQATPSIFMANVKANEDALGRREGTNS
ncbi:hypothetical protein ACSQ67_001074 [Phaseolus vulgaris]